MKLKTRFLLLSLFLVSVFLIAETTCACTVIIAGKNTTTDGSILFGKTEDDGGKTVDYLRWFPQKNYNRDDFLVANLEGLEIPQRQLTYGYLLDECPPTHYSNMVVNEWGIAFGSNGCKSKEDGVEALEERGQLENGGIGFMLRIILAQRAKTARQAVLIAAELIDQYGYRASGRNLNIVGPNEAWQLQMVRGKHYVARRVRDDEVAIVSNTFSIREVDMDDRENFIASPDLIDYAIERGWYNPDEDGEFDFARAYADEAYHNSNSNNHRQWILAKAFNTDFAVSLEEAEMGEMPVSFQPKEKISVKDMMGVLRNHYENTELDMSENHQYSPHHTPHTICRYSTHKATIVQQRDEMPVEIGTLIWRALGQPCQSVFVPWYLGTKEIPGAYREKSYHTTGKSKTELVKDKATNAAFVYYHFNYPHWKHRELDVRTASGIFHMLGKLVDANYSENHPYVQESFHYMEEQALKMQPLIEEKAMNLYKNNKEEALRFITNYSNNQAINAYQKARTLSFQLMNE